MSFPDSTNVANSLAKQKAYQAKLSREISILALLLVELNQISPRITVYFLPFCSLLFPKIYIKEKVLNFNIFQNV